ncbi:RsmE family RNA methyltransferase [Edaphobacter modestus]|uniref:Ribosomal RNA small subunit methyltransferase E n=1 Tax=Edaphobacter modestus TaxID=388466 RepID=A0A4Q7YRH0_9BACT|nr:16S rRNA (uracil(1498)-N(3))-methyltransferase [Edaphobacter modestus]RZU40090.1 16S rRNA (uracil1498-N3)-methyltransferase [Edaphobacter modestus]
MTRRRWIADTWTATTATLSGEQAEHLARVLRAAPGQVYDIVAGGFLHRGEILSVQPSEVVFALHEELESDAALPLHLLLAVFKFDHMEWAIEKATELGVAQITPVLARRTEKHLAQASSKRAERWRRIVLEASKQSRRTTIPEISEPAALKSALDDADEPMRILLSETEQSTSIASALAGAPGGQSGYALAIGPEGGWTPEEMNLFTQHGWLSVTLGPRILRAETAAIAAIAILSSHLA